MVSLPSRTKANATSRWDRVFAVLSAEPRRQIVDELVDVSAGESIPLPEAVVDGSASSAADRLRLRLCHHHLPLLEAEGVVHWESDPLRAYRGPNFEEVSVVLESLHANATEIPDRLVIGCDSLEQERAGGHSKSGGNE
ncbi:hypothetical protein BDK88_3363 [Natrinema hispanicum]|uniref:ArsR family transcriptional regulator n=1 Tax=Natrinema hispanicum TaxID=392421 RepID=A0A482Y3R6_9EURY|nr:hypothetical protein [Natrinema hispanicum]RZV08389.1 hypothetical protein BDK88_3363 [Natrinema hispanicum]